VETDPFWSVVWDEIDGQSVQRALCPACERARRAAMVASDPRLATAQQQAQREETQALAALNALSQELQEATRRGEPPERLNARRVQLAELVDRVRALQTCALVPPD
jgi:anti-sigma factor ChrR (cupin superfamily)